MEKIKRYSKIEKSNEKNFGIVFGSIFLIIFFYIYLSEKKLELIILIISFFFYFLSFVFPKLLYYPNVLWHRIGIILGNIVGQIVMGIIFFIIIMPIKYFILITSKKFFDNKIDKKRSSYWINRTSIINKMKNQY